MKSITIAVKDMTRSFRSAFALVFMFIIPLLVTGMFYLMFGNVKDETTSTIAATRVVVVNLDQGNAQTGNLGQTLMDSLKTEQLTEIMEVSEGSDAVEARRMVDAQQAGVAIIIPADFSAAMVDTGATTEIEFYQDPTLTLGPQIVRSVLDQFIDNYTGIKLLAGAAVVKAESGVIPYDSITPLIEQYLSISESSFDPQTLIDSRALDGKPEQNPLTSIIGPIMAGMMIFYAFFTGVNTANSILKEAEEGTLPRLFTTPTSHTEIFRGKFLSVGLTVLVQVVVLILAARLIFNIRWGSLPMLLLVSLGIICCAAACGIMICSLMKSTKQGGIIFGGLLTVTGMIGMVNIFTGNPQSAPLGIVPLFTPQGWAARAMLGTMSGQSAAEILPYALGLFVLSVIFFIIGVWRFQKRYA